MFTEKYLFKSSIGAKNEKERQLKSNSVNIITSPLAKYVLIPLPPSKTKLSDFHFSRLETLRNITHDSVSLPKEFLHGSILSDNEGQIFVSCAVQRHETSTDEYSIYKLYDAKKRELSRDVKATNRKVAPPIQQIPRLSSPICCCSSPVVNGLHFFVSVPNTVSANTSATAGCYIHALLIHGKDSTEVPQMHFSDIIRLEKGDVKITTLICHPSKPLLIVSFSSGSAEVYSYNNLHLNMLKKTGANSGNGSIETDHVEDGEEVEEEQEKASQSHLPTSASLPVTAVQLQWLCTLLPPTKSNIAVSKNISIGPRFIAIVWDGLITALYDLWPIVHSKSLPPSPLALSPASVFQFNKQQKTVNSEDRLESLCFHPHAPLLFQLRILKGTFLLYSFDLRQSLLSPLGLHQVSGQGKSFYNLRGHLQCVASCGNLLLTLGCEAVISLQLCEHWLMTKGLLAFVDPLLSPIQLPDVYRFDDGSHQEISRDIKLLHRSLTSLAIRMEYANLEKGEQLQYHLYELHWLECMMKPDRERKERSGSDRSAFVGSFPSLMKRDGGRPEASSWLHLRDEDSLPFDGISASQNIAENLFFYPSSSPTTSLTSQPEGDTDAWGLLNGVLFRPSGQPLACVLVFRMTKGAASTTSPLTMEYCCTAFRSAMFLNCSAANLLRKESDKLSSNGHDNAMLCLSSCGRRISLLCSNANTVEVVKLSHSSMNEYTSWQLPHEMDKLWTGDAGRETGNQLTPVIAVFSSKLKDYGEAMSLHSCALGIGMPLTLCNFALQPGEKLLEVKSNFPLLAVRSTDRVLLLEILIDRLQVIGTASYTRLNLRDAALSLTWVGSAVVFARSSGRIDYIHSASGQVRPIAARRHELVREKIADRILGVKSSGDKHNVFGHLCSLPIQGAVLGSPIRIVGALPDRLLLSYLNFADISLPLPMLSTRPCNYLEPLVFCSSSKSGLLSQLCLPYLSLTYSQVQQLPSPWGNTVTVPSFQHSRTICRAVISSQHTEIALSPLRLMLVGCSPNLSESSFPRFGWLTPSLRALVLAPHGHLKLSAVQQLFAGRSNHSAAFNGFFASEIEGKGDSSVTASALPHNSSFLSDQIAAVARGLVRNDDLASAAKLVSLFKGGRAEHEASTSSRATSVSLRLQDLGRAGRTRFIQSSQVASGALEEKDPGQFTDRYRELEQQLLQSFVQRGGSFGIPLLPGNEVLSLDLLEDFMGQNLLLESIPHPNNLSIGTSASKISSGHDNVTVSSGPASVGDDEAGQTVTIPSTWTPEVGQGRDMDKVVGYWRFSDSVFPDEEGFSSHCQVIGFSCVCVVTDLSKYAGGLEVLISEKDPTSVVSLEVSTHPTLEAGEKHEITKLLYDAVFSEPASSLRCAIPRGSQLDLGLYHRDHNRARLTFEIAAAFKKNTQPSTALTSSNRILLQRKLGFGGHDESCIWTLFVDDKGTLSLSFATHLNDETDEKYKVSVPGLIKYPLLEQIDPMRTGTQQEQQEEVWHNIAFTIDSSRSRWTAHASDDGGRVLTYLDPVSVSLYIDGERVCEPALVLPPVRRITPDTEDKKNNGVEEDLSVLGPGARSVLLVGPGLGNGWRITEVRAWADIRSEVELTQQRDLCLPLAVKRRRMQLRLQGQVGNTRKIFGPFRDPNPRNLSSSGQQNSDGNINININIKNENDLSENPVKPTIQLLPPQTGKLSMPLPAPSSIGGVRNSLPPPNSNVNTDQSDTSASSGSGLSAAARNRLMRRQANPPTSTEPPTSAAPISNSTAVKVPRNDADLTCSWLLSSLGGRLSTDDITRAAAKTKLFGGFDFGSGSFAVALTAEGFSEQTLVANATGREGEDRELLLPFELVRWIETKAQTSKPQQILRLTYPSRVKPESGYPSASMIFWGGSGCPANVLRLAVYDQRYIRVLDLSLLPDTRVTDPLLLSSATKVCELPMKSTPLAFWLFINSSLILLITHQAGFTLRLNSTASSNSSSSASQNALKPIKILDRCDIPPNTSWEDRSVLDLAVFSGGWTLLVTVLPTKGITSDEVLSSTTTSLYHARSGTSLSLSALAACFYSAEKVMEKETITVWLLIKASNRQAGSGLLLGKIRLSLEAFSPPSGVPASTSTSAYQLPWTPEEILNRGEVLKTLDLTPQMLDLASGAYYLLPAPAGRGDWIIIISANGKFVRCAPIEGSDGSNSNSTGSLPGLFPDDRVQAVRLEEPDFLLAVTRNGMLIRMQICS